MKDPIKSMHLESAFSEIPFEFEAAIHEASRQIRLEARIRRNRRIRFIAVAASLVLCVGGALLLLPEETPALPTEPVILASPAATDAPAVPDIPQTSITPDSHGSSTTGETVAAAAQRRFANDEDPCYHRDSLCPSRIGELEPLSMQQIFDRGLEPCEACCGDGNA